MCSQLYFEDFAKCRYAQRLAKLSIFAFFFILFFCAAKNAVAAPVASSIGPTWSETAGNEDMAAAVAAFVASGTPTLVGHAEAGNYSSATTAAINTGGATLLVAWLAVEDADPSAPTDNYHNTWQPLPVYANGPRSHGRFFYAYNPTVGPGHTFTAGGRYIALEVSAWSGMLNTSAVYQGSTGAVNPSTKSLATGSLSFTGPVLLVTAWASDSQYYKSLAVNQGFTVLGSLTNFMAEEIASHAYLVSGVSSPTWSETGGNEDMAAAEAAFEASGTPTLVGHAEAGNYSSATTAAINTSGATLLVAWLAVEDADPSAPTDNYHNTWQPLPVYANGRRSHGRFFYAYNPTVGPGHTFTAGGRYIALEVSAWSGMLNTSAVYQGSTGAVNPSTKSLATGSLSFTGPVLLVTAWGSDSQYYQGLAVNQGFTVLGSLTNFAVEEIASHAYLVSGVSSPTWSETGGNEDMAVALAAFVASGTPTLVGHAEAGNYTSATTTAINTSGATLLVAWLVVEGADPAAPTDKYHNTWQPLPVYANGRRSHGRFFYAYNPTVGPGHTFAAGGRYIALEVSAWSGMLNTSAVYQGSTGAVNASTEALATGSLSFPGPVLLVTAWGSDSQYYQGLAVNQGFTVLGSLTNFAVEEIASHAYLTMGLTATGTAATAVASLSPSNLIFATQPVGTTSAAQTLMLNNTGNAALTLTTLALTGANPGDFAQTNTCGSGVAAGANCTISVTFKPTASGSRTAAVTLADNATGSPQTVTLSGTGTSTGTNVSLSPSSLTFGNCPVDTGCLSQSAALNNTGSTTLTMTSIAITGADPSDFTENNTCNSSVAAGGTCTIVILFTPSASGTRTAALAIADNASGSPQSAALSGTGTHDVILSWTASTTPGLAGYNVYRGTSAGGESSTPLNSSPIRAITYTDANVTAGVKYYYMVTAVSSNGAIPGSGSNEAPATVPSP